MPNITKELPIVIKHRAQLVAAQPYVIKPGAARKKMHSCIQKPPREVKDSAQEKEIVAVMLGVNKKYFELHQLSYQQEVEDYQARSETHHVWGFVNEYRELGAMFKMPHPCSWSLAYEQAKLKESNGEWVVELHTSGIWQIYHKIELYFCRARMVRNLQQLVQEYVSCLRVEGENNPKQSYKWWSIAKGWFGDNFYTSTQVQFFGALFGYFSPAYVSTLVELNSSWSKQSEQVRHNVIEQPNTKQQAKKCYTNKRRSKGVFEVNEQLRLKLLLCEQPIKPLEGYLRRTINQFGLHYISEQTKSAACRLRLTDGPRGDPRPNTCRHPCCQPEVMGECRLNWKTTQTGARGGQENRTSIRIWVKRSDLQGEEALLGKQLGTPNPVKSSMSSILEDKDEFKGKGL